MRGNALEREFSILIVEDDTLLAETLQDVLADEGYRVGRAENGEAALRACSAETFDLALVDMKLPDILGSDLVGRLASACPETEYIIMTGYASLETAIAAVGDKRIVAYETKPLDMGHFMTLISQVAQRREAEAAVRRERERADRYLDIAAVIIVALDKDGDVTLINRKGCDLLGYPQGEIMGRKWFQEFVPESVRLEVEGVYSRLMAGQIGEETEYYENPVVTRSGEERLIAWHNTVVWDGEGEFAGTLSSGEDITERRQVEAQLKLEAELLDGATDSIFLHDVDGNLFYTNESAYRSRGYSKDELMQMNVNALEIPKFSRRKQRRTKQLLKTGFATFESAHVRRDRSIMPVEVKAKVIQSGERKLILSVTRDITERKKSEEDLEKSYKRLQKAMEGTTSAFELVTEMRDPYTSGHQRRTTKLASDIAKEMGLSRERIEAIQMAGSIHDIGKMYVPAEILSKPGQLTDIEFSLIKLHPKAGHDILSAAETRWPVARIVLQHHERMNGSGYPQGLAGDQIMLESRILAVADTVEAMSSHRPYRPAFPIEVALSEIEEKRDIFFDPDVVDACLRLFHDGGFRFD